MNKKSSKPAYYIIDDESHWRIQESVNKAIKQGYIPLGGLNIEQRPSFNRTIIIYQQAMVKRELDVEKAYCLKKKPKSKKINKKKNRYEILLNRKRKKK